jgi:hypothetical protein
VAEQLSVGYDRYVEAGGLTDARGLVVGAASGGRIEQPIRAAELVAALSIATDLGTGQPLEHAVRSAVLAVRLGELAGDASLVAGQISANIFVS